MAATVKIGGYPFPVESYSISEDSTPLAAGDTSGGTGVLNITIPAPQSGMDYFQTTGMKWLHDFGRNILQDKPVTFRDSKWGTVSGRINSISQPNPGLISITAITDMNVLNAYNVQAQPFVGTLGNLIRYYVGLATDAPVSVDAALNSRPIPAPGWTGELWYHLKMLAVAHEFEIALVDGVLVFRQLRQRELVKGRDIDRGGDVQVNTLAQKVEVYQYNNEAITNQLVYPIGGWTPELEVLNVNAGETAEYTLELSASVSSIQTPTMVTNVSPRHNSSSVYTVVAGDGLPVNPAMWAARGGSVEITINPDTTSLHVKLRGAEGIPLATGGAAKNFQLALGADTARYSTLRIVGTGVIFDRQKKVFRTGVTPQQTGTEIGVTIDNIFLSTKSQTYSAGVRAAADFAGPVPSLSAQVNRAFKYDGQVTTGNLGGARIFDSATKRPYRVRTGTVNPATVSITAEDDLLHEDVDGFHFGKTYGQVQATRSGHTYRDDYLMGLR